MTYKTPKVSPPPERRKRLHLNCLAWPDEAKTIKLAATLEGKSRSAFMVDLALERAKRVVEQHGIAVGQTAA